MSRPLVIALVLAFSLLLTLPGCSIQGREQTSPAPPPPATRVKTDPVQRWLRWQDSVATMDTAQLASALEGMAAPGNANQLFYAGLLKQQSDNYENWVIARDTFRALQANETLSTAQRQLAGVLERFNQSRINWYQSRDELRQQKDALQLQLEALQEQNALLEQKIKAITDLESTISTRKED